MWKVKHFWTTNRSKKKLKAKSQKNIQKQEKMKAQHTKTYEVQQKKIKRGINAYAV